MMQSTNPALQADRFGGWRNTPGLSLAPAARANVMTVSGTVNAALILTGLLVASGVATASLAWSHPQIALGAALASLAATLVVGIALFFRPLWAPVLAPIYAVCEGALLGLFSAYASQAMQGTKIGGASGSGVVVAASVLTLGTLAMMLLAYKARLVRATPLFQKVMLIGTASVCLFVLATWILSIVGVNMSVVWGGGPIAILITLALIVYGAFMFIMDFDLIERRAAEGAPKAMEWYGAYALLVTVVFLYIQFLRLLIQIFGRKN